MKIFKSRIVGVSAMIGTAFLLSSCEKPCECYSDIDCFGDPDGTVYVCEPGYCDATQGKGEGLCKEAFPSEGYTDYETTETY